MLLATISAAVGVTVGYWVGYRDGLHCRLCTKHQKAKSQHHQILKRHNLIGGHHG